MGDFALATTNAALRSMEMGDITGLVRSGHVMNYNDFEDGPQNWGQLYVQNTNEMAPMAWIKDRHKARIEIRTPDLNIVHGMAIRRMSRMLGEGHYLAEFVASIHDNDVTNPRSVATPKMFEWGIDTAGDAGERGYFALFYVRNGNAGAFPDIQEAISKRWVLRTYAGGTIKYHDLGAFEWPVNEQKCLPVPIALLIDTVSGKYVGVRIGNWIKRGYFADEPDPDFDAIPVASGPTLPRFASGFNVLFSVTNHPTENLSEGVSEMLYQRTTYLGSTLP